MINFFYQDYNKQILNGIYKKFKKDTWVNGNIIKVFESNLQKYLKTNCKVSTCNSGSDALILAFLLDWKKNKDIYLTTPISYMASSSIPKFLGLKLIFVDVEKDNFLISLDKLEDFLKNCPIIIKKRIRGIINVELFGSTVDLQRLRKIAKKYNLSLIGDCAQSLGTCYKSKSTISYYDYSITSFYPTKVLSCYGDGGAIFLKKNYHKSILLKNNGHTHSDKSTCKVLGINSRLDSFQAFVLNEKLPKLKDILNKKKIFTKILSKNLNSNFKIPVFNNSIDANNYIFAFYITPKHRKKFLNFMKKNKVECKIFYEKLLSKNKLLKPIYKTNLKNAENCCKSLVCIPNHDKLKIKEVKKIANIINNFN